MPGKLAVSKTTQKNISLKCAAGGCSIDEVHEDMRYRFAQCRQIVQGQTAESLRLIALAVEGEIAWNEMRVSSSILAQR